MSRPGHGLAGVSDAGAFLARLVRLDPAAVVRLRPGPAGSGLVALWGRLPWGVLVTRAVPGTDPGDVAVSAADLLAALAATGDLPARRDPDWRWSLPPDPGVTVESVGAAQVAAVARAAARTFREAARAPRAGERAVRDALLDHVPIVALPEPGAGELPERVPVSQRLVQAVARMGFLGPDREAAEHCVHVRLAARWVGLAAPYGTAWLPPVSPLAIRPPVGPTNV